MNIGLSMVVKNEESNIEACLTDIVDLFSQIVIIDTGSTDKTCELLETVFAIKPITTELTASSCFALSIARNHGFDLLNTPWILSLDADERIERNDLINILTLNENNLPEGLFCSWLTDNGCGELIDDYKLFLFRKGYYMQGLVHENIQAHMRMIGGTAEWTSLLKIKHYPNTSRILKKEIIYAKRLACAREKSPDWLRYHWFSAYAYYRQGQLEKSIFLLKQVHHSGLTMFPVESLNASMILISILVQGGEISKAKSMLRDASSFYQIVSNDFEVKVNFRLLPWFQQARENLNNHHLNKIKPYYFPY